MKYILHVQHSIPQFNHTSQRKVREAYRDLLGICEGILADKKVNALGNC